MAYEQTVRGRFRKAKSQAKKRGIDFKLSLDQYRAVISQGVCDYCDGPLNRSGSGLDRVDNARPYTAENVVPCCGPCNSIKGEHLNYLEAKIALGAVAGFRKSQARPRRKWPLLSWYPKQLTICGQVWEIHFVRHIKSAPECVGLCTYSPDTEVRKIEVKLGQTPKERFKTWFHEVMHAYEFESKREIGEKTIRLVEHWVGLLIGDNF